MPIAQEPIDHHYLPKFYLSRWCNKDGKLCRYSRPRAPKVVAKFVTPRGTAYERRLYENTGLPEGRRQSMEANFLSKLDSRAANALELLERGVVDKDDWTPRMRSDWSRFLVAQQLRAPEDIDQWKSSVREERRRSSGPYVFERSPRDHFCGPPTPEEYEQADRAENDLFAMSILRKLMDNSIVGQMFNDLHWLVLDMPEDVDTLVTSDKPIWMTAGIGGPLAFLLMPIGPRRLFTAVRQLEVQERIATQSRAELVAKVNHRITRQAAAFVYANDDSRLQFVEQHMSKEPIRSLMIRLAEKRGHALAAN